VCGIVGALALRERGFRVEEPWLNRMRDVMEHRGPDGAGTWIEPGGRVGLGHRRLSIIDLSDAATQPMSNEDGTLWLVFNGEIYNHAEIRRDLERLGGHRWRTDHSDTEVILHAYETWGVDCLQRLRGMFAFALWDGRDRSLLLVRDRIGVKPLYYTVRDDRFLFASEIKALLADPDQRRAVDEGAFFHYLSFLTTPAPQTLFAGIRKLPGGTWMRVHEDGRVDERVYWDVWDHTTPLTGVSEEEIAERVLDELRTAVRLRKVSDVPVGVFLSGGIDSSTNAALFSEGEREPVRTFSIGYGGGYRSYNDELPFARSMAARVGARHHERVLGSKDMMAFLPRMVHLQDEPIADPVCMPVYYVSELARREGVTVCQVGEGADELFWGYPAWSVMLRLQGYDDLPVPRAFKRLGLLGMRAAGRSHTPAYEWLRRGAEGVPVFWGGAEAFPETHKHALLSPRLRREFRGRTSWEALQPIRSRFEEAAWEPSHLHWMSYLDLRFRLPELLLMRVDKMSMGVSLEGRVPFLDHKLVELALSIPSQVKTRDGTLKRVLKQAVRGVIPDEIIDRPKQGFGVPLHDWFLEALGERARREVLAFTEQTDLLDRVAVERLLRGGNAIQAWYLLNLALWWKEFVAGGGDQIGSGSRPGAHDREP
jgi:asparagine synthase (glutamine-hydrolysing)